MRERDERASIKDAFSEGALLSPDVLPSHIAAWENTRVIIPKWENHCILLMASRECLSAA